MVSLPGDPLMAFSLVLAVPRSVVQVVAKHCNGTPLKELGHETQDRANFLREEFVPGTVRAPLPSCQRPLSDRSRSKVGLLSHRSIERSCTVPCYASESLLIDSRDAQLADFDQARIT